MKSTSSHDVRRRDTSLSQEINSSLSSHKPQIQVTTGSSKSMHHINGTSERRTSSKSSEMEKDMDRLRVRAQQNMIKPSIQTRSMLQSQPDRLMKRNHSNHFGENTAPVKASSIGNDEIINPAAFRGPAVRHGSIELDDFRPYPNRDSRRASVAPLSHPTGRHVTLGTLARLNLMSSNYGQVNPQGSPSMRVNDAGSAKRPASATSSHRKFVPMFRKPSADPHERAAYQMSTRPLQGSVLWQSLLHYVSFIVIFITAQLTWSPRLKLPSIVFYIVAFCLDIQASRLLRFVNPFSAIPLYTSIIPFGILLFYSRRAHMLIMVLWYVSIFAIFLQVGNVDLHRHLLAFSFLFLSSYILIVSFMERIFVCDDVLGSICSASNTNLSLRIVWPDEGILILACSHLIINGIALERFIKTFAVEFLERERHLITLEQANAELRKRLTKLGSRDQLDIVSPLVKAIEQLKEIRKDLTTPQDIEAIDKVLIALASDQLYKPTLGDKPLDQDVRFFLQNVLQTLSNTNQSLVSSSNREIDHPSPSGHKHDSIHMDPKAMSFLEKLDSPYGDLNVLEFSNLDIQKPLLIILMAAINKSGCAKLLQIPTEKFLAWTKRIESGYLPKNPYHNALHAADVVYMMYFFLTRKKFATDLKFDPEEVFAALIAAAIHDYKHPGLNNAFHVNTLDPLAVRYNDSAVLEHFHVASAFEAMDDKSTDFMAGLQQDVKKRIRELVISMVLSTDMAQHFEWIGKFKNRLITDAGFDWTKPADRTLVLNLAMKASDVNNASKPFDVCVKWTELITEEFFLQGDEEKRRGLPISAFMNRVNADVPKSQVVSISVVAVV